MDTWTDECGDSNCIMRDPSKPRGMCTNGGCQHLKARSVELTRMLMAMGAEIVAQRRELEAARAVVEAAEKRRAAQVACDAEAERPAPSRSSAPMVRLIGCDRRLNEALDTAARGEKAGE